LPILKGGVMGKMSNRRLQYNRRKDYLAEGCSAVFFFEFYHNRAVANVKTLKGTRKLHSVRTVRSGVVLTRRLSCSCHSCQHFKYDECENSAYVDKWGKMSNRRLQYNRRKDYLAEGCSAVFFFEL
jgi:coproporphyrinogen III oxidase-like Fe-S oxidoreductase